MSWEGHRDQKGDAGMVFFKPGFIFRTGEEITEDTLEECSNNKGDDDE